MAKTGIDHPFSFTIEMKEGTVLFHVTHNTDNKILTTYGMTNEDILEFMTNPRKHFWRHIDSMLGSAVVEFNQKVVEELKAELEIAKAKVAVYEGTYQASEDKFFSDNEDIQQLQVSQILECGRYTNFLFGLTEDNFTIDQVRAGFRRWSRLYHPDRQTGNAELASALGEAKDKMEQMIDNINYLNSLSR